MKTCPFCAEEIQELALKCKHCGEWLPKRNTGKGYALDWLKIKMERRREKAKEHRHAQQLIKSRQALLATERATLRIRECVVCVRSRMTVWVLFKENKSYFYERLEREFSGYVCCSCMSKRFAEFELKTMLFTWWGLIGMVVGPAYLLGNLLDYLWRMIKFGRARLQQ